MKKLKAKVISECEDKGREFKVRRMTYVDVIVNYPIGTGLKNFKYDEIELIEEGEIDQFLIANKEFLKIKLNRGISVFFYKYLKECIEDEINEELNDFNLLRDKYNVNKRGIWNKEIICMINKKTPYIISASGQNFKREGYSINIQPIQNEDFIEASRKQIEKLNEEIRRKTIIIDSYEEAMQNLVKSTVSEG